MDTRKITRAEAVEQANKVWKILEDAVGYGFNSSHAYSVALDSIYGAYLKAKYPLEYYSVVLNIYQGDTEQTAKIMRELNHFGIKVEPPTFGKSKSTYTSDHSTNSIYKSLPSIKYLNVRVADELYALAQSREYDRNAFYMLCADIIADTTVDTRQMDILLRLDFFKEFGSKEVLLEVYNCMADKKKANIELYPDFADRVEVRQVKTKKGKIKEERKNIKRPLKFSDSLVEATKLARLQNASDYEEAVRANPPAKVTLYEQIAFEKDALGYAVSTYPEVDDSYALVVEVNKKFTPRITLYQVSTGEEIIVKINKKDFWKKEEEDMLYVGDIIEVFEMVEKDAWKRVDGKFQPDPTRQEWHLTKCRLVRGSTKRKR